MELLNYVIIVLFQKHTGNIEKYHFFSHLFQEARQTQAKGEIDPTAPESQSPKRLP